MHFNQYSMYVYSADNLKSICDDKVLVDLQRLKSMKEYDEVKEYVHRIFGEFEDEQKILDYPNDIKVILFQKENSIAVASIQKEKQIFGLRWTLKLPNEN